MMAARYYSPYFTIFLCPLGLVRFTAGGNTLSTGATGNGPGPFLSRRALKMKYAAQMTSGRPNRKANEPTYVLDFRYAYFSMGRSTFKRNELLEPYHSMVNV